MRVKVKVKVKIRVTMKKMKINVKMKVKMSENEWKWVKMKMKVKIKVKMEMKVKIKVKMRIGTHHCCRCCRRLLCHRCCGRCCRRHHRRHRRLFCCHIVSWFLSQSALLSPPPAVATAAFSWLLSLPSVPTTIVFIVTHHCHHCRRHQLKPITKKRAQGASRTPPLRPRLSRSPRKDGILLLPPCKDCVRDNNIGGSRPWTPAPSPLPPRWLTAISVPRRRQRWCSDDDNPMPFHRATKRRDCWRRSQRAPHGCKRYLWRQCQDENPVIRHAHLDPPANRSEEVGHLRPRRCGVHRLGGVQEQRSSVRTGAIRDPQGWSVSLPCHRCSSKEHEGTSWERRWSLEHVLKKWKWRWKWEWK